MFCSDVSDQGEKYFSKLVQSSFIVNLVYPEVFCPFLFSMVGTRSHNQYSAKPDLEFDPVDKISHVYEY